MRTTRSVPVRPCVWRLCFTQRWNDGGWPPSPRSFWITPYMGRRAEDLYPVHPFHPLHPVKSFPSVVFVFWRLSNFDKWVSPGTAEIDAYCDGQPLVYLLRDEVRKNEWRGQGPALHGVRDLDPAFPSSSLDLRQAHKTFCLPMRYCSWFGGNQSFQNRRRFAEIDAHSDGSTLVCLLRDGVRKNEWRGQGPALHGVDVDHR